MTTGAETNQRIPGRKHDMPQHLRRIDRERIPDLNTVATRPQGGPGGYFSTTDREYLPISYGPNVPFEQVCVGPLLGNDVLQLRHAVFVGLDAEADRVDSVSVFLIHIGSTPTCYL